jgi:phosphohistidine swiveling domain-containing protein
MMDVTRDVVALSTIEHDILELIGGKAAGLGRLIRSGERVPDGFCITTAGFHRGQIPREAVVESYHRLGGGRVAVRSSATAEDRLDASFAGQMETILNVSDEDELLAAIQKCWDSLDSARATTYRQAHGGADAAMAVVVQRMIEPAVAGVTFTANPITGTRTEMVVEAVAGLGTSVVDGTIAADHYVITNDVVPHGAGGCLNAQQLELLRAVGRRIERNLDGPQDLEWAIDNAGTLWLLQARPVTTLFPVPTPDGTGKNLRVYLEVGHMQGLLRPVTPMGMSVLRSASDQWSQAFGMPASAKKLWVDIAGRMYVDLTGMFHSQRLRSAVPTMANIYGPNVANSLARLLDDPRLAARPGRHPNPAVIARMVARLAASILGGGLVALARPRAARDKAFGARDQVISQHQGHQQPASAAEHIDAARVGQNTVLNGPMMELLPPLYAGLFSSRIAAGLLGPIPRPGEIDSTQRGMPYNVTSEMDLDLWQVAVAAAPYRDLFLTHSPQELAEMFNACDLPEIGLNTFLDQYGVRGAAEIDVGIPRWREEPTPVFAALAGYLRVDDPGQAPDHRFQTAAADAEQAIDQLIGRAVRSRPLRATIAGFLLRRSRELAGLRELPKFLWIHPIDEIRQHLLAAGDELHHRGLLHQPDDIMYLTLDEADQAAAGTDHRQLAADRRAEHQRERQRRHVPGLLLSDGTMPENLPNQDAQVADENTLIGIPAAAGTATGTVRILHDPATAELQPGDILVAQTTDPGWTPLFLTVAGLITETGSPMAHGPTVAREYGIPAVICVPHATTRLTDGQIVTIDGNSGIIHIHELPNIPVQ